MSLEIIITQDISCILTQLLESIQALPSDKLSRVDFILEDARDAHWSVHVGIVSDLAEGIKCAIDDREEILLEIDARVELEESLQVILVASQFSCSIAADCAVWVELNLNA